ncbi:MAG: hypothetical protein QM758_25700 [Armatimonas sp.]
MKVVVYVEGGGNADLDTRCRDGFRGLFEKVGIRVRFVACGGRNAAFDRFNTHALNLAKVEGFPILLVDSEDPISNEGWEHVEKRDKWGRPDGISDEQILFMATCMETWMVTDRDSVAAYFGQKFNDKALGTDSDLENRKRDVVQKALETASKSCSSSMLKGRSLLSFSHGSTRKSSLHSLTGTAALNSFRGLSQTRKSSSMRHRKHGISPNQLSDIAHASELPFRETGLDSYPISPEVLAT